jgi:hypothetical protein
LANIFFVQKEVGWKVGSSHSGVINKCQFANPSEDNILACEQPSQVEKSGRSTHMGVVW